jgi:hypothetical protein
VLKIRFQTLKEVHHEPIRQGIPRNGCKTLTAYFSARIAQMVLGMTAVLTRNGFDHRRIPFRVPKFGFEFQSMVPPKLNSSSVEWWLVSECSSLATVVGACMICMYVL